jgi:hypothetical protein
VRLRGAAFGFLALLRNEGSEVQAKWTCLSVRLVLVARLNSSAILSAFLVFVSFVEIRPLPAILITETSGLIRDFGCFQTLASE